MKPTYLLTTSITVVKRTIDSDFRKGNIQKVLFFVLLLCINISLKSQVNLNNGLVGYYPFNGNANDESGTRNNGTVYGAILTSDRFGNINNAYSFDGTNDYIQISRIIQDDFSICGWFKTIYSLSGNDFFEGKGLVYADVAKTNNDFGISVLNGKFAFGTGNPDVTIQSKTTVNTGEWIFFTAIRNKSDGKIRIYINGVEETSIASGNTNSLNSPSLINIGGNTIDSLYFNGFIDDIRIYNRVLSQDEIKELYYEKPTDTFKIYGVSPNFINKNDTITDLTISAYPISDVCTVELVNGNTVVKSEIIKRGQFYAKSRFSWENVPTGCYDIYLISNNDTLILKKGFTVIERTKPEEPLDTDNDGLRNITTFGHIVWITQHQESWAYNYQLDNDIDGSETQYWNLNPITTFTGTFDGQSHKIRNLCYNSSSSDDVGFINTLASSGIIRNIGLVNCSVIGNNYTAGLVVNNNGTISNCYCSGAIAGYNNVGSIAGNNNGTINCCYNSALITGNKYVGGLAGNSTSSSVISKSYNQGKIIGKDINIAGIIGSNSGKITDCYNTGSVSGSGEVGGIAGWNYGSISNVYSSGLVNGAGNAVGAIIGINSGSSLQDSYSDKETSGGITSQYGVNGTQKTTLEMKTQFTYLNWDFTNIWEIISTMNDGYPEFKWSNNPNRIKSYTPDRTANVDSCMITIEGSGFTDSTKIFLSKTGQPAIKADTLNYTDSYCTARFNLKNAALGTWNLLVQYPDTTITIQNGLTVEEKKQGELKIEILGSDLARIGRDANFTVRVTNTSNFTIVNPCIEIAVSSADSTFKIYYDGSNIIDKEIFDKLGFDVREYYFTETDDITGQNRNCKLGIFFLSDFSAYESKELIFSVRSANKYTISTWQSDYSFDQFATDAINIVYTDGNIHSYIKPSELKSQTQESNLCDKIYADCYNNFMSEINATIGEAAIGQLLDLIPIESAKLIAKGGYDMINLYQQMSEAAEAGDIKSYTGVVNNYGGNKVKGSFLSYTKNVLTSIVASEEVAKAILDGTIDDLISSGKAATRSKAKDLVRRACLESLSKLTRPAEVAGYILSDGGVWALSALRAKEMCKPSLTDCTPPDKSNRHNVSVVSSFDPNDKIGYRSPSGSRYFKEDNFNFTYEIDFENKSTATAATQEVVVTDTLDLSKFNAESFRAGTIKIGKNTYPASYNVQENKWQIDMRPEKNLITNVTLTLDKIKGIAKWNFKSVDPVTMDWPQDVTLGFLPPNDSIGSGQGNVSFSIDLKNGLSSDVAVKNKASIVFDTNAPIITPIWTNTKDVIAPTSKMFEPKVISDSIATLQWSGEDNKNGSGVYQYNVYTKEAGDTYSSLLTNTSQSSVDFKFKKDTEYNFYVTAKDSVGNEEVKTNVPDIVFRSNSVNAIISKKWNDVLVCNNSEKLFSSYQWYKNDVAVTGATKQYYQEIGGLNGSYYVQVMTTEGKFGVSNVLEVVSSTRLVKVYPNPLEENQEYTIEIKAEESELAGGDLIVVNINGQIISRRKQLQPHIKLNGLTHGVYLIKVQFADGESFNEKLIVK